ncbi:hypothetical protein H8356DRAFT_1650915 [Neocallimastix lanati (nom. inval.)]|nr:hypothetical protein H8356DRAFT_1650915 [Neocallimastix sp. JGI-2020a]
MCTTLLFIPSRVWGSHNTSVCFSHRQIMFLLVGLTACSSLALRHIYYCQKYSSTLIFGVDFSLVRKFHLKQGQYNLINEISTSSLSNGSGL